MKNFENVDVAVALCPPSLLPTTVLATTVLPSFGTFSGALPALGLSARRHMADKSVVVERPYAAFGAHAVLMGTARDKATLIGTSGFRTWSPPV